MPAHPEPALLLHSLVPLIVENARLERPTREAVRRHAPPRPVIVAFGKGACSMARGALEAIGEPDGGVIVTPRDSPCRLPGLESLESTHPLPSDASIRAAEAVLEWARSAGRSGGLLALVSGGGSALVEKPLPGLTLEDIVETSRLLLESGLSILEINTVRKHLSQVKGGRLAEAASPALVTGVYASDVPGDRLDLIASGPTVPDPTTYEDAARILRLSGLWSRVPSRVRSLIEAGLQGRIPETPKPGSPVFERVENTLAASNLALLRETARALEERGYRTLILTSRLEGESREAAKTLASIALEAHERGIPLQPPAAILVGGETSVTVRNPAGRGGRNTELALALALRVDYWRPDLPPGTITVLSMDTDGIDGNTPSAGAIAYNGLTRVARAHGLDPYRALQENNTHPLLEALGLTVDTGPTGSNLNSITIILVH